MAPPDGLSYCKSGIACVSLWLGGIRTDFITDLVENVYDCYQQYTIMIESVRQPKRFKVIQLNALKRLPHIQ